MLVVKQRRRRMTQPTRATHEVVIQGQQQTALGLEQG
jgi:hypothetical protein